MDHEKMASLSKQENDLQNRLQATRAAKRVEIMRGKRLERRATLTPDQIKAEDEKDALFRRVLSTADGEAVLADIAANFPAIADGMRERMDRAVSTENSARVALAAQANVAEAAANVAAAQVEQQPLPVAEPIIVKPDQGKIDADKAAADAVEKDAQARVAEAAALHAEKNAG